MTLVPLGRDPDGEELRAKIAGLDLVEIQIAGAGVLREIEVLVDSRPGVSACVSMMMAESWIARQPLSLCALADGFPVCAKATLTQSRSKGVSRNELGIEYVFR